MRVKISYIVDVSPGFRRAVRHYYGKAGIATREEIKEWFRAYGDSMDVTLVAEHDGCCFKDE